MRPSESFKTVSYLSSRQYQVNQDLQLGNTVTRRFDLGYVDGRARDLAGYDGIVRVGSAQEQMPSLGTAERGVATRDVALAYVRI